MEKIFDVDSNEIKRILSLHEESTKKQYLNVISEQTNPKTLSSYETTSKAYSLENANNINTNELELYKGTKFVKKQSNNNIYLTTQQVTVGFPADLAQVGASPKAKGYVIYWCSGSYAGKYQFKLVGEKPNLSLNFETETWYDEKGDLSPLLTRVCNSPVTTPEDDEKKSKTQLTDTEKKLKANEAGYKTWEDYEKAGWAWKGNKKDNTQTSATQITDLTKQIQQSLGIQNPTGQLTTSDVDMIISKLS